MSDLEPIPSDHWAPPTPDLALLPEVPITVSFSPPPTPRPRYVLALLLFAATLFTTTTLGPIIYISTRTDLVAPFDLFLTPALLRWVWGHPEVLRLGLSFSLPALAILLAHELGHYLTCRRYGLTATLPYFLPLPLVFGTLGAFIRIRSPLRNKRQLFDVAIAGPFAGFVVLLPFLIIGIARSQPTPLRLAAGETLLLPSRCLAMEGFTRLFHGPLAPGMVLNLHPFALAAWLGLLATALNLIPLSQLDGGHLLYAVAGRLQRRIALLLWLGLALASFHWPGWTLWCVITALLGLQHPPVVDESRPLDAKRRWLALLALLLFIVSLTPYPLREIGVSPGPQQPGTRDGLWAERAAGAPDWIAVAVARRPAQNWAMKVTGPSLTSSTSITARKRPVATSTPR